MMMLPLAQGLNQTANIIKGFAIAIGIAFTMYMVWLWWVHRQRERSMELAARARGAYAALLQLTMHYPDMAHPGAGAIADPVQAARYRHFVAGLLTAADEVLLFEPTAQWRDTLVREFLPHKSYFASEEFRGGGLSAASGEVQALVRRVVAS